MLGRLEKPCGCRGHCRGVGDGAEGVIVVLLLLVGVIVGDKDGVGVINIASNPSASLRHSSGISKSTAPNNSCKLTRARGASPIVASAKDRQYKNSALSASFVISSSAPLKVSNPSWNRSAAIRLRPRAIRDSAL